MFVLPEQIKDFLEKSGPIFFVTPNPNRAIGLEKIMPNFHIICSQKTDILKQFEKNGIKFFLLDDIKLNSAGRILRNDSVINYIKNNTEKSKANILTFKPSPMIEKVCKENNFRYLGSDWKLNRKWENKIIFTKTIKALGLKNPNSKIYALGENCLAEDFLDFSNGKKYIIQFARGYSGKSSFVVSSENEFLDIAKNNFGKKVKISDYIEGDTYTMNFCVGDFGVIKSAPIFQITGFSEFNKNILGTCGNDYAYTKQKLSLEIIEKINDSVDKLSLEIKKDGYKGIFGMDFIISDGEVYLIEVNPRMIGSIPIFTKLEIEHGRFPMLLLHVLSFLEFGFSDHEIRYDSDNLNFSQIIFRNNKQQIQRMVDIPKSGIYSIKDGGLIFEKEDYFAGEMELSDGKFLIQSLDKDSLVSTDSEYLNVQIGCGIMKDSKHFIDRFDEIKELIFSKIVLG